MLRSPAVAGQFYPGSPHELASVVDSFLDKEATPRPAIAAICPHAGYVYSGRVAAQVLSRVEIPRRVVVLGPNHRGVGADAAVMSQGQWETPLGRVDLDPELGGILTRGGGLFLEDASAHRHEHSLEVQVPFLQALRPDFLLTPICLGQLDWPSCRELGRELARAVAGLGEPVLLVVSTDMTHYESAEMAEKKDRRAIERILALDPQGLYETVMGLRISMCGVLPTTVALVAARELGASRAELVAYTNSGVTTGDYRQVVGYAGLIID
ncbi:MAG: AmmeMemoRadiSam system protein B [Deltaproteobacteria bacterium]|nr:AmmeMemoRadiSam system protein B [Deltaproteobacteria bacterium]